MKTEFLIEAEATWQDKDVDGHLRKKYEEDERDQAIEDFNSLIDDYHSEQYEKVKKFFAPETENFYLRSVPKIFRIETNKVELDIN